MSRVIQFWWWFPSFVVAWSYTMIIGPSRPQTGTSCTRWIDENVTVVKKKLWRRSWCRLEIEKSVLKTKWRVSLSLSNLNYVLHSILLQDEYERNHVMLGFYWTPVMLGHHCRRWIGQHAEFIILQTWEPDLSSIPSNSLKGVTLSSVCSSNILHHKAARTREYSNNPTMITKNQWSHRTSDH